MQETLINTLLVSAMRSGLIGKQRMVSFIKNDTSFILSFYRDI